MQVSWIDPDEIRDLLAQIEGPLPRPAADNFAWELNTLPLMPMNPLPAENMVEGPSLRQAPEPPSAPPPSEFPMSERSSGPASGDLWRIRERLRSLREQAQESGILPRGEETAEAEPPVSAPIAVEPPPLPPKVSDPPASVVEELIAEFTATVQNDPSPPPVPEAEPTPIIEEALPSDPVAMFDPMNLPGSTLPPEAPEPMTIEYAMAPDRPDYEPLFSHGVPRSLVPPLSVQTMVAPPAAPAPVVVSPFSIAEPEPEPAPEPDKPPFVVPNLGLSDRLSALANWATERLGTAEVLLVDDYGDVLWGGHAQTPLVLSAMMACHAAQRATAETACSEPHRIDKDLANGRALTVLPARTRYGVVSLAAIQDKPMTTADEHAIRAALILAVEGNELS